MLTVRPTNQTNKKRTWNVITEKVLPCLRQTGSAGTDKEVITPKLPNRINYAHTCFTGRICVIEKINLLFVFYQYKISEYLTVVKCPLVVELLQIL